MRICLGYAKGLFFAQLSHQPLSALRFIPGRALRSGFGWGRTGSLSSSSSGLGRGRTTGPLLLSGLGLGLGLTVGLVVLSGSGLGRGRTMGLVVLSGSGLGLGRTMGLVVSSGSGLGRGRTMGLVVLLSGLGRGLTTGLVFLSGFGLGFGYFFRSRHDLLQSQALSSRHLRCHWSQCRHLIESFL